MSARRRLVLAAATAGLASAGTWAQTSARVAQIGWITNKPMATLAIRSVFTEAMRERGWIVHCQIFSGRI